MTERIAPRPEFAFHKLNEAGQKAAKEIAEEFSKLLDKLDTYVVGGREYAICKTKLEEACFFAKKAMAIQPKYQEMT